MTISKITRLFLSAAFTLGLGCSLPLGCGSTREAVSDSASPTPQLPEAPPKVVAALKDCVDQGAARLTSTEYAVLLDVKVTEDGKVFYVRIKSSLLDDPGIETCMRRSLLGISLPESLTGPRASPRLADGTIAPESRSLVGHPGVLAGPAVALGPIMLAAGGITVVVGITIYAMSVYRKAPPPAEQEKKPDCDEVRKKAAEICKEQGYRLLSDPFGYWGCISGLAAAVGC